MHLDEISKLLRYNPETGHFYWIVGGNGRRRGRPAGRVVHKGYRCISINGQDYREHRLAWLMMTGAWPDHQIDHIDLNPGNNAWANLRAATNAQNCFNQSRPKSNTSGFKGVHHIKTSGKYRAVIKINYRQKHLGCFETAEEAHAAYSAAAREHFGDYARSA